MFVMHVWDVDIGQALAWCLDIQLLYTYHKPHATKLSYQTKMPKAEVTMELS